MFGGWKTDFYVGYDVPASDYLSLSSEDSSLYILNISFSSPFLQAAVDRLEVRVILPEFSSDLKWITPFEIDSVDQDTHVTYLDTVGRPVLILQKNNCVRHHAQPFQVLYHFSSIYSLQEPLLLISAFFLFFLASMAYMRIELSLGDGSDSATADLAVKTSREGKIGEIINRVAVVQPRLIQVYSNPSAESVKESQPLHEDVSRNLEQLRKDGAFTAVADRLLDSHANARNLAKRIAKSVSDNAKIQPKLNQIIADLDRDLNTLVRL